MRSTKYFFAMFGDPRPPEKDTVESGVYHPDASRAPFPPEPGDIMLLYCTGSYTAHPMLAPGVGVVLGKDDETVRYRYLPLSSPISKDDIEGGFQTNDVKKFRNRRFSAFWLFEISRESFVNAIDQRRVNWP